MTKSPRFRLYFITTALCTLLAVYFTGEFFRPTLPEKPREYSHETVKEALDARDPRLPEEPLRIQKEVDYSEGASAAWYPKEEAPILAELVAAGELPPVAERTGPEPVVMEGPEGNGQYGGTWTRVASSASDVGVITWRMSGSNLFRTSPGGDPIVPHIAKGYEVSEDLREWTIFLRKGMRWSDGHPFTAEDFLFWWEKNVLYFIPEGGGPAWMKTNGKLGKVEEVDSHTVRFSFEHPNAVFLKNLTTPSGKPFAPAHYLSKFHPEVGDRELIEAAKALKGVDSDRSLYGSLGNWANVDHPRLWPWIYRTNRATPPQSFVRNPYYFAVDTEGRQLPYVDRVLFQEKNAQLIPISASGGDITMQTRHIKFTDYTLLIDRRESSGYEIKHWYPAARSTWMLFPNLNKSVLDGTPTSKFKHEFLNKRDFRKALSISIDRQKIIDADFNGLGTPSQNEPGPDSPFHSPELANSNIDYKPEEAARILDRIGLEQRDSEGMRTFPDGTRMTWYLDFTDFTGPGPVQFVVDDWAKVGLRAIPRERTRPLFATESNTLTRDFTIWTGESEFDPILQPRNFFPSYGESFYAAGYGRWYQGGGLHGRVYENNQLTIEPPIGSPARQAMEIYTKILAESDQEEQVELFKEIFKINMEEVWTISIATPPPQLVVVKDGFRNVPDVALFGASYSTPANAGIETYFFDEPKDSAGALAAMKDSIINPIRSERAAPKSLEAANEPSGIDIGKWLRNIFVLIGIVWILMIGVRHPFIGRRLVIMIPTLGIMSVVCFTMIQLPPGSFVETKILELQMSGDEAAIEEVKDLVERFHLDEPMWKQYTRWLGFKWFITFSEEDSGLLQGNMGRSMEGGQSVNVLVGDRVLMTFLVSLGTMLFTWATALPIGIYSAVRQYSIGDYFFTVVGFLGMCIPNFLLAILIMYWSDKYFGLNVTGLFSIEYATQPEWTWGKFIDLLKHIWVPVVIIGTGGTAGMIRVMRGNLLDELKKPYVTTARAKGVKPMKLLLKYPVRLALNPFISGIGGIFPGLVSGGGIVAIVLGLPMVGPVMLSGLLAQDVYLTASMMMMLSLLGVLGTLFSDLLLLWVDPRIRMEGKKK